MKYLPSCFCLAGVLLLTACNNSLPLLQIDPAVLGPDRVAQQRMQLNWDGDTHVLENMLETGKTRLEVIGLAMGVRVYSFSYNGKTLIPGLGHLPPGLSEQRIANDMLLIHAPAAALRSALPPGWTLEESPCMPVASLCRILYYENRPVVKVEYQAGAPWQGRSRLFELQQNYQLLLDSASEP